MKMKNTKRWFYRMVVSLVASFIILFVTQGNDLSAIDECGFGNISMNRSFNDSQPRCLEPQTFGKASPDYAGSLMLFTTFIIGFLVTSALDITSQQIKNPKVDKK